MDTKEFNTAEKCNLFPMYIFTYEEELTEYSPGALEFWIRIY